MKEVVTTERIINYIRNRLAYGAEPVKPDWVEMSAARWAGIVKSVKKEMEEEK